MSTRSSARNLFPPLDNPELKIRRRSRTNPTLLNNSEMAAEGNVDLPVPDLRTMEELCQPSLNGRGGPIAIQTTNFRLKNDMIQQPVTQIDTFYNGLTLRHRDTINAAAGGTFMKRRPEECYDLIENMTAHHNDWDTSAQRSESSSSITSSFDTKIAALKAKMAKINKNLMRVLQPPLAILKTCMLREPTKFMKMNTASSSRSGTLPGNTITNPNDDLKGITTRSGTAYQGSTIPTAFSSFPPVVEPLADLDASINLMPLSVWNKLSLPDLSPTCMILELADHWISRPVGVAEDVFVKTSRYSANYSDMTENRIDVINMACEEYSQEVLGFSDVIASGNTTPYYDPIVSTTSSTLTPFENNDFLLEEVDAFLALKDDPTSSEVDKSYVDTEGDILLLEAFLNDDPSLPPSKSRKCPKFKKNLKSM
uniref:Reverse transcriptase domain-containing protein n=1 Tax=Tanacetum cinerariifolium TaxID=118510 RepID=A0A699GNR1_TANCI|nr:reverse transcriptase domain-containing protein [Tanacetum cinerariifolium]